MSDSTELRHLESEVALKQRIYELTGRRPSATQVAYVSSCLLHGRLYWDSAAEAPLETRPLLLYYGAASFAKALVLAKNFCQIGDIASGHGISCSPGHGDKVGTYVAQAKGLGLFQQFNDVVANLNRVHYFKASNSRYHYSSTSLAAQQTNLSITLQEILSRVPEISKTYELCVGEPARLLHFQFNAPFSEGDTYEIRVDLPESFSGRPGLAAHVKKIRERAPFLSAWRVGEASHAWDKSIVLFHNYAGAQSPAEIDQLVESDDETAYQIGNAVQGALEHFDALKSLPPLAGGYDGHPSYIETVSGFHLSEYANSLLGLLTLSSLVRYQPHVWTSAIHRRRFGDRAIDDQLLPAIEEFLDQATKAFPKLVTDVLLQK